MSVKVLRPLFSFPNTLVSRTSVWQLLMFSCFQFGRTDHPKVIRFVQSPDSLWFFCSSFLYLFRLWFLSLEISHKLVPGLFTLNPPCEFSVRLFDTISVLEISTYFLQVTRETCFPCFLPAAMFPSHRSQGWARGIRMTVEHLDRLGTADQLRL